MKQIINISIERELTEEEVEFVKELSEEEKQKLINRHKKVFYEMFEEEDISEEHIKNIGIQFAKV